MSQKMYQTGEIYRLKSGCLWYGPVMVGVVHEQLVKLPCSQDWGGRGEVERRIRALEAQLDLRRHVGLGDKGHMWLGLGPTVSLLCPGEP